MLGAVGAVPAWAQAATGPARAGSGTAPVLRGTEFDLVIQDAVVDFTGRKTIAPTINGMLPGPTLRWRKGDTVTIRVTNRLNEPMSLHWHGILLPYQMDGVPGISFPGIAPGETFTYRFKVAQSGSYWYHSHSGFQEMTGVYGAIVIDGDDDTIRADRDYSVLLSDWTEEDPMRILSKLKTQSDYYNYNRPTVGDFFRDVSQDGLGAALEKRKMWNQMRMNPTDLADLLGRHADLHLMNGVTPAGNWTGLFRAGEDRVAALYQRRRQWPRSTTCADSGAEAQGGPGGRAGGIDPVSVDEFLIGLGETCDVLVTADRRIAHTVFGPVSMDRSVLTCAARRPCGRGSRRPCRRWTSPSGSPRST